MCYTYPNGDVVHGVGVAFECRLVGGELRADQDEIIEVAYLTPDELIAQGAPPGMAGMACLWHDLTRPESWPVLR
jgi:hypothetical protein